MKQLSQNYYLATAFNVFNESKVVRFWTPCGMHDVGVPLREKNEIEYALSKRNDVMNFTYSEYQKKVWSVCDYIIQNKGGVIATDFFVGVNYSKIEIKKIDFYTFAVTLKITHNNQSETKKETFDTYDTWFMMKLIQFVQNTMKRGMFDE